MPTIHYGDAFIRISEMSRAKALDCFRELEFMVMVWINSQAREDQMNRDIATMIALSAPAVVTQNGQVFRAGEVKIALPEDETFTLTLPLTKEQFDGFSYSLSDMWLEAAVNANEHFHDELKKALGRIMQMLKESQSGKEQSSAQATFPAAIPTTGTNETGT